MNSTNNTIPSNPPNNTNLDPCFTLIPDELNEIKSFHNFCMYNAAAYCAICLKKLYPDQIMHWPKSRVETLSFPCSDWGYPPLREWPSAWVETDQLCGGDKTANELSGIIVCKYCEKNKNPPFSGLKYPGKYQISNIHLSNTESSLYYRRHPHQCQEL